MIISFAKTTGALLAGEKTVTRREWSDAHAARVIKQYHEGKTFDAWNYSPRVKIREPRKVATIRLTEEPYREGSEFWRVRGPSNVEFISEGFAWMCANGLCEEVKAIRQEWERKPRPLWVVRFEVLQ